MSEELTPATLSGVDIQDAELIHQLQRGTPNRDNEVWETVVVGNTCEVEEGHESDVEHGGRFPDVLAEEKRRRPNANLQVILPVLAAIDRIWRRQKVVSSMRAGSTDERSRTVHHRPAGDERSDRQLPAV